MGSRSKCGTWWLVLVIVAAGPTTGIAADTDEAALAELWQKQTQQPTAHQELLAATERFESAFRQSPYVLVSRSLAAWHRLQLGQTAAAGAILEGLLSASDDPFHRAADGYARCWLTRLDRDQVKAGLQAVYRVDVGYPAQLPATIQPAVDRWGQPWRYQLTAARFFKGLTNQTYRLESATLGARSELPAALAQPWPRPCRFELVAVDGDAVTFKVPAESATVVLIPGSEFQQTLLVTVGDRLVLLAAGDIWHVLPRPQP